MQEDYDDDDDDDDDVLTNPYRVKAGTSGALKECISLKRDFRQGDQGNYTFVTYLKTWRRVIG
jgi:hypothetical protein